MSLPQIGSLTLSIDNPVAPKGTIGFVLMHEMNHYVGQKSVICVFENNQYAEYCVGDFDVEVSFLEAVNADIANLAFKNENEVIAAIKSGVFESMFKALKND